MLCFDTFETEIKLSLCKKDMLLFFLLIGLGSQVQFAVLIEIRLVGSGEVAKLAFVSLNTPMSVLVFVHSSRILRAVFALVAF